MKTVKTYLLPFLILISALGCNTLYNTKTINIEVLEPGKVKFPDDYSRIALRYNNTNVAYNPKYSFYFNNNDKITDTGNLDSVASWVYFDYVLQSLRKEQTLDTVMELAAADYSTIQVNDSLPLPEEFKQDSVDFENENSGKLYSYVISRYLKYNPPAQKESAVLKNLDPQNGLYTSKELEEIADSTGADLLFSLDHFVTQNAIVKTDDQSYIEELVLVNAFWTTFDLRKKQLVRLFQKSDTIIWDNFYTPGSDPFKLLPPRRDAVLNASDMAGTNFAAYLSPHWINVERFYYRSGHVELKKTNKLVEEGKWMEAAQIWKQQVNNPNKSIAAKCMFNLALANEMTGDLASALDWVVQSYHVFGEKNDLHAENCRAYIQLLAQRRINKGLLDDFFNIQE